MSSTPISSFQCFWTAVLHDHCLGLYNLQRFYTILPSDPHDNIISSLGRCGNCVSSVPRAPIDNKRWSLGWNACLQTPEVTIHLTASHWLRSVFNFWALYPFRFLFHCVLFLPHFLALEVPFCHLRSLQKQGFQRRSPEPSLFSSFCRICHGCLLSTERDL